MLAIAFSIKTSVSRRGAEEAEGTERLSLRQSRSVIDPFAEISTFGP
jgi:hypothetical protein